MDNKDMAKKQLHCLVAALTLLVKAGILEESKVTDAIETGEYEGLFDLMNEKYKEIVS